MCYRWSITTRTWLCSPRRDGAFRRKHVTIFRRLIYLQRRIEITVAAVLEIIVYYTGSRVFILNARLHARFF